MAKTIPQLTDATTVNAADELIIQQSGITKRATAGELMNTAPVTATGSTAARTLAARAADVVNVKDFGAVGDGVADDTAAIQAALDASVSNILSIKPVFVPSGQYKVGRIQLPYGAMLTGAGGAVESLTTIGTRFLQNSNDDVFIFGSQSFGGSIKYWAGAVSDFSVIGYNTNTNGYAFNTVDESGDPVWFVDQSVFRNLTIRNMPQGGFYIRSAYPLTMANIKFLWNGGPAITFIRVNNVGLFQSVNLLDISGDGNIGGLLRLDNLSRNDGINIVSLKSEARVNNVYGGGVGQQLNAIVTANCADAVISIAGANHISSIPNGSGANIKPGDLINITDSDLPRISWNGVIIGFPNTSTGTDPFIVNSSVSSVYKPDFSISSGTFNLEFPFSSSKALLHRNAVTGATPSVAKCNALTVNNSSATTITDLLGEDDGQVVIVSALNGNTTIQHNSRILLNNGRNWAMQGASTLSLIFVAGAWREVGRSYGAATGPYTVTNVTTDRAFDADATTLDELADVVGTLIGDLSTRGIV